MAETALDDFLGELDDMRQLKRSSQKQTKMYWQRGEAVSSGGGDGSGRLSLHGDGYEHLSMRRLSFQVAETALDDFLGELDDMGAFEEGDDDADDDDDL